MAHYVRNRRDCWAYVQGGAPLPVKQVTIPPTATQVKMRVFTTGHGGTLFCDGGSNNGASCTASSQCPGGSCQNCDEFCHRTNRILKNGAPIWSVVPFRTDCSPGSVFACQAWNACGWPSCTFSRAGWCPGATVEPWREGVDTTLLGSGALTVGWDIPSYENTCRPDATVCAGALVRQ